MINAYAHYLQMSNNRIESNQGSWGGGIRAGFSGMLSLTDPNAYQSCYCDNMLMQFNHIAENSGLAGVGGGISLYTGCDNYVISRNDICGNFTQGEGAGIGHQGLSRNGQILNNRILFNQSFYQGNTVSGGGIIISGEAPLGTGLSPGSGNVIINANLIQGNLAGAGDGGAIRLARTNGADVQAANRTPSRWYTVGIYNNMIMDNMCGLAGGAISMQDVALPYIIYNTIINNDSAGTAGEAFAPGSPNQSTTQTAGIVSRAHSPAFSAAFGAGMRAYSVFSNPTMMNDIIWHSRSFTFHVDPSTSPPTYGLIPNVAAGQLPEYHDLGVVGTALPEKMNPVNCILTNRTGYSTTNIQADPKVVSEYVNGARNSVIIPELTTAIQVQPAFDEGGNYIDVRFGPLTPIGDSHIQPGSPAIGKARPVSQITTDYDGQRRPTRLPDIGADELY